MGGRFADVQDNLAVFDMLRRHAYVGAGGVDDNVRRLRIVGHPFVHRTNEIRSF